MTTTYKPHAKYADIFPPMSAEERQQLEDSIRLHGLQEKIVVNSRDEILDGLNRFRACLAVEVEPQFEVRDMPEDQELAFMVTRNLVRRHLSTAQRAAIASNLATLKQGQTKSASANSQMILSQADSAKLLNVSERSVAAASAIKREAPELHAAMLEDAVTLNGAEAISKLPPPERSQAIEKIRASHNKSATKKFTQTFKKSAPPRAGQIDIPGMQGAYSKLLHVLKALPLLTDELAGIGQLMAERPLAPEHARQLRTAIKPLKRIDWVQLVAAAASAISQLDTVIKTDVDSDTEP